ncbi:ribosome biogenesis GTPase A [Eubacterium uniforme]|uniref:Ribosome biogenesis GTPase A n=1 Tax=Eubacterium uniforme TaxID=39495 RepID=A0A1T4V602_9FIRM|nr:ribosome biogenesis GTPase A [Eubacterium uniforme]
MSDNKININWYPGHMTKAKRMMEENIKLIDLVIEIVDARIPLSSRNPDIDKLANNKYRLICLNKSDLSDKTHNEKWMEYFKSKGFFVTMINSKSGAGVKNINNIILDVCKEKIERDRKRGIKNRPIRAMVCGIPNVGKSTFINSLVGKAAAKTGNKPGVTKGKQWIRLNKNIELLDTPGILWPKFESNEVGLNLALIGSINDEILNLDDLSYELIERLKENYGGLLAEKYSINEEDNEIKILSDIAVNRGCIAKGGEPDIEKAAKLLFDDYRNGRIGKITLEYVE